MLPFAASTVLNISDDHIDHHGSMQNYRCAKLRIYRGAQRCVFNRGDLMTQPQAAEQLASFGLGVLLMQIHMALCKAKENVGLLEAMNSFCRRINSG